jgi:hypothetical protein
MLGEFITKAGEIIAGSVDRVVASEHFYDNGRRIHRNGP